jgi:hypothetical protein
MNKQIVIRTKSTGLYFIANEGFTTGKRESATSYDDSAAVRAAFQAQYAGELEFIGEGQYADGAASLPTAPVTQEEIEADLAEKATWVVPPVFNTRGLTEA